MIHLALLFSSRRRHTRWPRDWSSDVCSSDLPSSRCRSAQSSSEAGSGTLQKMIVQSGSATMDIDLNRLNGINSMTERDIGRASRRERVEKTEDTGRT